MTCCVVYVHADCGTSQIATVRRQARETFRDNDDLKRQFAQACIQRSAITLNNQGHNFTPKGGGDRGRGQMAIAWSASYNGGLGALMLKVFAKQCHNMYINFPHLLHICKGR